MRHKQHAIYYTTKPIDAKDSFWITAPREGYSNRCYSEWETRLKGTRFDREVSIKFNDGSSERRGPSLRSGSAAVVVERGKLRQGFALMGAE